MMPNIGGDDARGLVNSRAGHQDRRRQRSARINNHESYVDPEAGMMSTTNAAAVAMRKEIRKLKEDDKRLCKQFEEWERRVRVSKGLRGRKARQLSMLEEGGGGGGGAKGPGRSTTVEEENSLQVRSEVGVNDAKGGEDGNLRFLDREPTREMKFEDQCEVRKSVRGPDEDDFRFEVVLDLKGIGKRKRDDSMIDDCDGETPMIKKVVVSFESSTECKIFLSGERSKKRSLLGGK